MTLKGRIFIARHGETVFNFAKRMQGDKRDTPLTRTGFAQADAMGAALASWIGPDTRLKMWSSPSGRALQTLAVIAEHIEHDWHEALHDPRLYEINVGDWAGRTYADIMSEIGPIMDADTGLFSVRPPKANSEQRPEIPRRARDQSSAHAARNVVSRPPG